MTIRCHKVVDNLQEAAHNAQDGTEQPWQARESMKISFREVCESAKRDHGIRFYPGTIRHPEVTIVGAGQRASMLRHPGEPTWIGTYRETRDVSIGDQIHKVSGSKGAVAEWLVRALVDGPSTEYAEWCGVKHSARTARYGAMASGPSPVHLRSDFS